MRGYLPAGRPASVDRLTFERGRLAPAVDIRSALIDSALNWTSFEAPVPTRRGLNHVAAKQ